MSYDNNFLFSAGQDGVFAIFEVSTKDSKFKKDKEQQQVIISEEILIQKAERDKFQADIEHLKASIEQLKINNDIKMEHDLGKKTQALNALMLEIENKEIESS